VRAAATALAVSLAGLGAAGCGGGALDPRGQGAEEIADLWWVMFWLSLIPLAIVIAAIGWLLIRRRRQLRDERPPTPDTGAPERWDRRVIIFGGVLLPIALLLPVAAMTVITAGAREPDDDRPALEVGVTGHQFWWDLTYPEPGENSLERGEPFRSANEIHIPVGRPVELVLRSRDVIHSIWIPQLDGKMDLVPGRVNRLRIQADEEGVYEGRCAEFCGLGHGLMFLRVVAEPEEEFEQWREREAGPATVEADAETRELFADRCGACHVFRGIFERETVGGTAGPDLSHFGSRRTIAAGVLPNTPEALARWITDPRGVKPGNKMPWVGLDPDELDELIELLGEAE
jgi:cytochrome c oxidase subunit II